MKTKVFPTIAPKILFENTLQPGLHLQDLRNFPMRTVLKVGGVPLSSRAVHISMGKFQSGFLKKHIIFPGCILLPDYKNIRVEHFDPGK